MNSVNADLLSLEPAEARNTLLIVDDEQNIRNALHRLLRKEPYEIVLASGPFEALEIVQEFEVGVVLSDHAMPGMTGIELLRRIKELDPRTIRMVLTGQADLEMAISAINNGEVTKFFTKPWDDHQLKADLRIAFNTLKLQAELHKVLDALRRKNQVIDYLERQHPGITNVERNADGAIVIPIEDF